MTDQKAHRLSKTRTWVIPAVLFSLFAPTGTEARYSPAVQVPFIDIEDRRALPIEKVFSDSLTDQVVQILKTSEADCARLPVQYRIDCLGEAMERAARKLGNRPDYKEAKAILTETAQQLRGLARANEDPNSPPIGRGKSAIRAVKPAVLRQALRRADQIVGEAETKLIRAAGSSGKRRAHYTKIAAAVGSTKVLLRSS